MVKLVFPGEFTALNEHIGANNRSRYHSNDIKREETERAWADTLHQKNQNGLRIEKYPVHVHFSWYCSNKKKDPDNISFAKKYILDGVKDAGLIPNDGWNQISGFSDSFHIDSDYPRVEVTFSW